MPLHDRFDLAAWIREFPLQRLRLEAEQFVAARRSAFPERYPDEASVADHIGLMYPHGEIVVGPKSVAVNEQLRAEAAGSASAGPHVPTDVVVWCSGEPAHGAVTKTGGRPYRSASSPWPTDERGKELRFIAQLSFVDSRDLVPDLPGDVLLIFGEDEALLEEPGRLVFEWVRLGIPDLVPDVPAREDEVSCFYAVLHRTSDWPDADDAIFPEDRRAESLAVWEGTKLGGVPHFIQDDESPGGRFIAALGSISVPDDERFPFVNVAEPRGGSSENDLMIGDMGSLYLFLFPDGRVLAVSQCY